MVETPSGRAARVQARAAALTESVVHRLPDGAPLRPSLTVGGSVRQPALATWRRSVPTTGAALATPPERRRSPSTPESQASATLTSQTPPNATSSQLRVRYRDAASS